MNILEIKMSADEEKIIMPNDARAGRKTSFMPWVLGLSVVGAVIILLAVYAGFAAN